MGTSRGGGGQRALLAAGYLVLFVLGVFQGLIGSFQYGRGPGPLAAIILVVIIFLTCILCGRGVGTFGAAALPAIGWILASFILAMSRPNGSVVITATSAGEWYLYGGAFASLIGAATGFYAGRARRPVRPR
ncbi:MAG TPA: DUF6113 family protein [Trebonia sp.]|nr:DUF6113 family protein [Trebonia sp.]